jgi:hypothetical protein
MGAAMSVILGIDIGASGAIALLTPDGELVDVFDMPFLNDGPSGRRRATLGEASKNWAEVEKYLRREARNV